MAILSEQDDHRVIPVDGCRPMWRHRLGILMSSSTDNEAENLAPRIHLRERKHSKAAWKPSQRRLIEKDGKRNVRSKHIPRSRYLQDLFTTVIDARWRWVLLMFTCTYFGSWLLFALCWFVLLEIRGRPDYEKCFTNVHNFTEAFLLSVETQLTIGYGGRQLTGICIESIVLLLIQAVSGLLIDACMIGLIFAKISRPGKRQSTILFSPNAVITVRDGKMCFMFQVADLRKRQLSQCVIRLHLFRSYVTKEGKVIRNHVDQLRVGQDWVNVRDDSDRAFLLLPATLCHVIDEKSPLYNVSSEQLLVSDWEFVPIIEGTVEATGCTTQALSSYLATEVNWGFDFIDIASDSDWHEDEGMMYQMTKINQMTPAPYVPHCSAEEFYSSASGGQDRLCGGNNLAQGTLICKPEAARCVRECCTEALEPSC